MFDHLHLSNLAGEFYTNPKFFDQMKDRLINEVWNSEGGHEYVKDPDQMRKLVKFDTFKEFAEHFDSKSVEEIALMCKQTFTDSFMDNIYQYTHEWSQ